MKATELVKNKGLDYAKNIVHDSPENALYWVEGYEFKCGQSANDLSKETKEKYFVSIPEIKDVLKSHELIKKDFESVEMAEYEYMVSGAYSDPYWIRVKQAITDVESCQ